MDIGFNPHPTRRLGAMRSSSAEPESHSLFQSSPNPKVGCHNKEIAEALEATRFNPHPTRRLGAMFDDKP